MFNLNTYGFDSLPCPGTALQKLLRSKIMLTEEQKLLACDVFALGASLARTLTDQYRLETIFAHGGDTEFFRKALPPSARVAEIAQGIGKREELWKKIESLSGKAPASVPRVPTAAAAAQRIVQAVNTPGFSDLDITRVHRIGNGEQICLTGRMPWIRSELYSVCMAAGFTPVDKYNSKVALVVYADINSGSNKLSGAFRHGTPVEHILDFVKRINAI